MYSETPLRNHRNRKENWILTGLQQIIAKGVPDGLKAKNSERIELDNKRADLRGQIAKFQKWMLKPEIDEAQADAYTDAIATIKAEVAELDEKIQTLDRDITAQKAQIATLESPEALKELIARIQSGDADASCRSRD